MTRQIVNKEVSLNESPEVDSFQRTVEIWNYGHR